MRQQTLFTKKANRFYARNEHGGDHARGKRKSARPLARQGSIHLILKSDKAKGKLSLRSHQVGIGKIVAEHARRCGVKVCDYANVGNHLHFKIRIQGRSSFQKFLRSISSLIARLVTKARRGQKFGQFWTSLAYTRVLKSAFEDLRLRGYFRANRVEAEYGQEARDVYVERFEEWLRRGWYGRSE